MNLPILFLQTHGAILSIFSTIGKSDKFLSITELSFSTVTVSLSQSFTKLDASRIFSSVSKTPGFTSLPILYLNVFIIKSTLHQLNLMSLLQNLIHHLLNKQPWKQFLQVEPTCPLLVLQ